MSVVGWAEFDPWRRRVLGWHWPGVRCWDDVRAVRVRGVADESASGPCAARLQESERPDLLCGGFPCQDLSVAGKRRGLAGERSGLFFEFARIADEFRPKWLLIENVPWLLSSADGRDFGVVLATLADLGYGLSWRVLDARFFGVPQRRRRVFIVGCAGGESESAVRVVAAGGEGDLAAGKCSWQRATAGASRGARVSGVLGVTGFNQTGFARWGEDDQATTLARRDYKSPNTVVSTLQAHGKGRGYRIDAESAAGGHLLPDGPMVRRLMPVECERLMSWPDNWTAIDGDDTPDGRRYAACGDGVVSNVAEWIGRRMLAVNGGIV